MLSCVSLMYCVCVCVWQPLQMLGDRPNFLDKSANLLTLFLHVTWTRYFVSGHNDNSTFDDCVNRFPMSPPPDTSHVTKQSAAAADDFHAMFVATNELSRTIDVTSNAHVSNMDLFILVDALHSSQHCKERERERKRYFSFGTKLRSLQFS